MGFVSDIVDKLKDRDIPSLEISKENMAKIEQGESVVVEDKTTGIPYLIRVNRDKVGSGKLSVDDLEIRNISNPPRVAAPTDVGL